MDTLEFVPVHTPEHFQAVEALANPIWREHYIPLIGQAQVEYMLAKFQTAQAVGQQVREGALYYLIQAPEKENIGFLSVIPRQGELFISKFYLLKEERGKGYARMALEFIKSLALDLGLERLILTVHKRNPSVKVYEALGFKVLGPVVTDIGGGYVMDDYRMGLDLV
jgi:RimJ/RimL family protein N-acetyltransferase